MLIFKLGSLEYKIRPTEEYIEKFKKDLKEARTSGVLVCGPDVEVISIPDRKNEKYVVDVTTDQNGIVVHYND